MSEQTLKKKSDKDFSKNRTFVAHIFTFVAVLLIFTVAIIVGYIWFQYGKALRKISNDQMSQVTETVKEKVTNYLKPAAVMAELSSQVLKDGGFDPRLGHGHPEGTLYQNVLVNPLVVHVDEPPADDLLQEDEKGGEKGLLSLIDLYLLEAYGIHLLRSFPQVAMINIGDEQGNFFMPKKLKDGTIATKIINQAENPPSVTWKYRDDEDRVKTYEISHKVAYDPRTRPWYEGAKRSQKSYWTDVYIFFSDQAPGITTSYPVFNPDGSIGGVFSMDIALSEISTFLKDLKIGNTGIVYIVNAKSEMVAYPDPSRIVKEKPDKKLRPARVDELGEEWVMASFFEHERTGENKVRFESGGNWYLGAFTDLGAEFGKAWKIAVIVPEDDFLGPLIQMRRVVIMISLAILLISVYIAMRISQGISKPIMALSEETKKIEKFELDGEPVINSSIREIQIMAHSISSMKKGLKAFKKYVPSALVRQLIQTGEEAQLGGKKVELSIFFSDIQGFTTISETTDPETLMFQLFEYNNELTNIILNSKGTIDKYIGDAIMAFWGAPVPNEEHALFACNAALLCHQKLDELNGKWGDEGKKLFITRFGIHTGPAIVGNMGSDERMNYSILGDSVNLASRVEGINKTYGTRLIVTQATYKKVSGHFVFRPLDIVAVKGKREGIPLYELIGRKGEELPPGSLELRDAFAKGFKAYLKQEWDQALNTFTAIQKRFPSSEEAGQSSDEATNLYVRRCSEYQENPPGKDWDGVYRPKTK